MSNPTRKDNLSSTFYWKDYENDEGLRVSSLAAQGLWMRLLCIAAKADPYGYLFINGCEIGVTGVADTLTAVTSQWATLMAGTPAQNGNSAAGNSDFSRKAEAMAGEEWEPNK